jgi:hypothetical protein
MITVAIRALTGLVLALLLVTGCSGGDPEARSDDEPGSAAASSPTPSKPEVADGAVGSEECALGRERLSFVVRDWGRAFGSIGRGDHHVFTGALVEELEQVRRAGRDCNGSAELDRFLTTVRRVDARARQPSPDYALYDAAIARGNAWLRKVGYGKNALSVG